jgi:hypothetical protein
MTAGFTITAILVLLFGVGTVACMVAAMRSFSERDTAGWVMEGGFGLFIAACLVGTVAIYRYESGPTFELLRSKWRCSASHVVKDDDGDYTVCDQYSRR